MQGMTGIDPQVAIHKLFTDPNHPLVRQKRRKFSTERLKVIEEEVAKLIKAKGIREAHYPDRLSNVLVTPKKGESGEYVLNLPTSTRPAQKIVFLYPKLI